MYYLKCNHCGQTNALRSEYVTFCGACSKKMTNSYADWKQRNPEGNFESYCEAVGISEAAAEAMAKPKKKKSSWNTRKVLITIVAVLVGAAISVMVEKQVSKFLTQKSVPEAWLTSEWQTFSTPKGIAVLESPVAFSSYGVVMPPEVMANILSMEMYQTDSTQAMQVSVHEFAYKRGIPLSLEGAAAGSANEVQHIKGATDFEIDQRDTTISGQPAILQEVGYTQKGSERCLFHNLMVMKDNRLVQIILMHRAADETGKKVTDRIISSVKLKNI